MFCNSIGTVHSPMSKRRRHGKSQWMILNVEYHPLNLAKSHYVLATAWFLQTGARHLALGTNDSSSFFILVLILSETGTLKGNSAEMAVGTVDCKLPTAEDADAHHGGPGPCRCRCRCRCPPWRSRSFPSVSWWVSMGVRPEPVVVVVPCCCCFCCYC